MSGNADKLRDLYRRFWNERDWRAGVDIFAPDIEWIGFDEVGMGGPPRHGIREIGDFFRDWLEVWDETTNDIAIEEITPDLIVVTSHFRGRAKATGLVFERDLGQLWEFRDGLVVRQTMYRTPEEAREAARSRRRG